MPQLSPSIYLHSSCCNCFPEEMHCCHHAVFFSHDTMHYSFFRNYFLLLLQHSLLFFCMQQLYLIIKSLMLTSLYYNRSYRIEMWVLCCSQCGSEKCMRFDSCQFVFAITPTHFIFILIYLLLAYGYGSVFCVLILMCYALFLLLAVVNVVSTIT